MSAKYKIFNTLEEYNEEELHIRGICGVPIGLTTEYDQYLANEDNTKYAMVFDIEALPHMSVCLEQSEIDALVDLDQTFNLE